MHLWLDNNLRRDQSKVDKYARQKVQGDYLKPFLLHLVLCKNRFFPVPCFKCIVIAEFCFYFLEELVFEGL